MAVTAASTPKPLRRHAAKTGARGRPALSTQATRVVRKQAAPALPYTRKTFVIDPLHSIHFRQDTAARDKDAPAVIAEMCGETPDALHVHVLSPELIVKHVPGSRMLEFALSGNGWEHYVFHLGDA